MNVWDATTKSKGNVWRVPPDQTITLFLGTWPVESDQIVWLTYQVRHPNGTIESGESKAVWHDNQRSNSYWKVSIGPFQKDDRVTYTLHGRSPSGEVTGDSSAFLVAPNLYLAILWHQHQPLYKNTAAPNPKASYSYPWVRLHAIRDYYGMASIMSDHPGIHLTINLTPSLIWQIEDYLGQSATDQALELTLKPAETLSSGEAEMVLSSFFDAHWHNQIFPHPRYKQLFQKRLDGRPFSISDLRDLQMWFNLAWFGQEFRDGTVKLATGETASVQRFIVKGSGFSQEDIQEMVGEQYKILRAIIPIHRQLQEAGQIEVSTTPFYHPIMPLLVDTDQAQIDRPGSSLPHRFAHPEDAVAQTQMAIEAYRKWFGRSPKGMWPAEGAVSQFVLPIFSDQFITWIATDREVLRRSGRWGYNVDDPNVLCQPYRAEEGNRAISIFFRDTRLSDAIGFHYYAYPNPQEAAKDFLRDIEERFIQRLSGEQDAVITIILDGENAWGAFSQDGRPFLHALYELLENTPQIQTVTFSEYLEGNTERRVQAHHLDSLTRVYDLFTASWIDENGSSPGVDLGTWIGEEEENQAWNLLGKSRNDLSQLEISSYVPRTAYEALYIAEGSDWFWWFGNDQESGVDEQFDDLFRTHLKNVYRAVGAQPPNFLNTHIVAHKVPWTFTQPVDSIQYLDWLNIITNCPGVLTWKIDSLDMQEIAMSPVGGVMAGAQRYLASLGPFSREDRQLWFGFRCTHPGCSGDDLCCKMVNNIVTIT